MRKTIRYKNIMVNIYKIEFFEFVGTIFGFEKNVE